MCSITQTRETIKIQYQRGKSNITFLALSYQVYMSRTATTTTRYTSQCEWLERKGELVTCLRRRDFSINSGFGWCYLLTISMKFNELRWIWFKETCEKIHSIENVSPQNSHLQQLVSVSQHCAQSKSDKNFKSFFFSYLIKRRLIQQLDNHYHCNCITRIISKNWYFIRLLNFSPRYQIVRKVQSGGHSKRFKSSLEQARVSFAVIIHHT